jgi:hypothetical protein
MSEGASFGNIVSSLRAVRNDYNEHLKAVPQYDAFLLVESSAQQVADTLRDVAPQMAADVAEALEAAKAKFQQHLTSVAEYRALLAIDKLINDVAADLSIQETTEVVSVTEPQQADVVVEPQVESAEAVASVAAVSSEPTEVLHVETAPQVEVAEHAAEQNPLPEFAAPIAAESEMTSAEAISQIQTALLHAEPPTEFGQSAQEAPSTSEAAELAAEGHAPDAQPTTATEPPPYGHETERAA